MEKIDLKKEFKTLYNPPVKEPVVIDVPAMNFLMVDGQGEPDGPDAVAAIEALYGVAYTLKFMLNKEKAIDYPVMALEGLWWADDMNAFVKSDRKSWKWTYMIMQPKFVDAAAVARATDELKRKKNPSGLGKLRFSAFDEGRAAQIMHIGPYSAEGPNISRVHDFIHSKGGKFDGHTQKHHEIYMSDPRRAAPDKLKTVIRQPFV